MKIRLIVTLSTVLLAGVVQAKAAPMLTNTVDVAAGRNLRDNGTRFCSINIDSKQLQQSSTATAVILLPKTSRLLDTRVLSRSKTTASCGPAKVLGDNSVVRCTLKRLPPNKEIVLRARYRQKVTTSATCTAYIQVS
ncbi:hypothetical protein EOL70_02540 [Leucothrix sargassi]|nr:hypothetical protein EOL70_02540 [Leucothrix sargassi]